MIANPSLLPVLLTGVLLASPAAGAATALRVQPERIEQHIMELSAFGKNPEGGVSRVAFSQADLDARKYVSSLMARAGLQVTVDAAGNLIGFRDGSENLPPIMLGSHIDSVPGGGNYDGDVGVIGAIEAARVLHDSGVALRHPLEVVAFADEEGGLTGSRAMSGQLGAEALREVSHSGLTIGEGIRRIGGDPSRLTEAKRSPGDIAAYLELHIEQGAVLDEAGLDIGIVTGIVGIKWWDVVIEGVANHAGTTPMNKRHDALLAAAELIQAVNRVIRRTPGNQVGTVGRIEAEPGAPNVIPGKVVMSLEIRDLSEAVIDSMFQQIEREAEAIAAQAGVSIAFRPIPVDAVPAPTDERVRRLIGEAAESLGLSSQEMPSGAGHDAQDIARIAPIGMIFVPSVGGISHSPKEFTEPGDMANGANVLLQTLLSIDAKGLEQ
ncbi:MAG: Zn-dependent hydrolase [Lysobacterales bacterium]|jgi:N-carbamoyl-L-amino-acid hydrolase